MRIYHTQLLKNCDIYEVLGILILVFYKCDIYAAYSIHKYTIYMHSDDSAVTFTTLLELPLILSGNGNFELYGLRIRPWGMVKISNALHKYDSLEERDKRFIL